jgi:hypothetical protein
MSYGTDVKKNVISLLTPELLKAVLCSSSVMKGWMKELPVNKKLEKIRDDEAVACFTSTVSAFARRFWLLYLFPHACN